MFSGCEAQDDCCKSGYRCAGP
ncbi:hypothetical protein [Brevundimonas sp.]